MGQKWIAMLAVTFEMKDGQPPNRAENVLRGAVAQLRLNIMTGRIDGRVKPGSAKVEMWKYWDKGQSMLPTMGDWKARGDEARRSQHQW